jgi:hypothetical protein
MICIVRNMYVFKFINLPIFAISLTIGLIAVYMLNENDKRKIYVYPTPENIDKILYRDGTNTCYEFKQKEVPCPKDRSHISKMPIQA